MLSARLIQAALFATALTYADTQPADWGFAKQRAKAASFLAGRFDQELGLLKGVRHFTYYYFLKTIVLWCQQRGRNVPKGAWLHTIAAELITLHIPR